MTEGTFKSIPFILQNSIEFYRIHIHKKKPEWLSRKVDALIEFQLCVTLQIFSEAPVGITVADIFMINKSSILTVSLKIHS